jgi:hypothetical protein
MKISIFHVGKMKETGSSPSTIRSEMFGNKKMKKREKVKIEGLK